VSSDRFYSLLKQADALHAKALNRPGMTATARAASYIAYRSLELSLGERHPHGRVLAQARELQARTTTHPQNAGKRVLFVSLRGWFVHSSVQALLAKALEMRGASATFALCSGHFSQCDFKPASDFHVTRPLCWRCQGFTKSLLNSFSLDYETLDSLQLDEVRANARIAVATTLSRDLKTFHYAGMPLYEWCYASIRRSLLRGDAGEGRLPEAVTRGYLESAIVYAEASRQLLDRHKPDVCVLINGLFHAERVFSEVARTSGVRVFSYETGFRPRTFHFTDTGAAAHLPVDEIWDTRKLDPLDAVAEKRLDAYFNERSKGGGVVSIYWPKMDSRREQLAKRLNLRSDKPLAVLFPNIAWDSATVNLDTAFRSMKHWVEHTISVFDACPERQLVIRIHPAEIRLPMMETRDPIGEHIRSRFGTLPANVRMVPADDPADSYELLAMSDAVLVYTSTLGLEATAQGRRVVVAAKPHYARRGFTEDVESLDAYEDVVMRSMSRPELENDRREMARRYANMLLYDYMIDFPWVVDSPRGDRRLVLGDLEELAPGHNAALDRLCERILETPPRDPGFSRE
jgi:hypothetical protein